MFIDKQSDWCVFVSFPFLSGDIGRWGIKELKYLSRPPNRKCAFESQAASLYHGAPLANPHMGSGLCILGSHPGSQSFYLLAWCAWCGVPSDSLTNNPETVARPGCTLLFNPTITVMFLRLTVKTSESRFVESICRPEGKLKHIVLKTFSTRRSSNPSKPIRNGLPEATDQPQQGKVVGRKLDSQAVSFPVLCCLIKASVLRFQKLKDTKGLQWKISLLSIIGSNYLSLFSFCQLRINCCLKCEVGTQHPVLLLAHKVFFLFACFSLHIFVFICAYFFSPLGSWESANTLKAHFGLG